MDSTSLVTWFLLGHVTFWARVSRKLLKSVPHFKDPIEEESWGLRVSGALELWPYQGPTVLSQHKAASGVLPELSTQGHNESASIRAVCLITYIQSAKLDWAHTMCPACDRAVKFLWNYKWTGLAPGWGCVENLGPPNPERVQLSTPLWNKLWCALHKTHLCDRASVGVSFTDL